MRKAIRVYGICAEVLEHLSNDAFANGNVSCEADYVLVGPTAHGLSSKRCNKAGIMSHVCIVTPFPTRGQTRSVEVQFAVPDNRNFTNFS